MDPATLHDVVMYGLSILFGITIGVAGGILRMNLFALMLVALFVGATVPPFIANTFFPV